MKGTYDLVVRGGEVIDGSGAGRFAADVGVRDGLIAALGDLGEAGTGREIDASGRIVAPGFIDVHTHDDGVLLSRPGMAPKTSQGVTTVIAGNCGVSLAPLALAGRLPPPLDLVADESLYRFADFGGYLDALDAAPPAVNAAFLVGHSTLRVGALDALDRPATETEIAVMRERLEDALDVGALGLSTGLFYKPARAAPTGEVIALAQALAPVGGVYTTHMRDESDHVTEALEEAFAIGRAAGVKVVISHHKVQGVRNFGRTRETLALIERARERQKVALDVYPYTASSTVLSPESAALAARTIVTWSKAMPGMAGRDLDEIADALGVGKDAAIERLQPAGAVYFSMDENDVRRVLGFAGAMVGSDGLPNDEHPHPRLWGAFPRVLGRYSRELGLFDLEQAVHRMTGLPAAEFELAGRGRIEVGATADLVVFDADRIIDRASFEAPTEPAAGIDVVLVNGEAVWCDGRPTGARPGRVLRRQALQRAAT
ncbi:MAG: amidohydrolase family protein [Alphaproteobacteria bacterium]